MQWGSPNLTHTVVTGCEENASVAGDRPCISLQYTCGCRTVGRCDVWPRERSRNESLMTTAAEVGSMASAVNAPRIEIRPVEARKEYEACLELQRVTWGRDFTDTVPVTMMRIAVRMGGVCMGAFGPDGELLGFAFGVTGVRNGELAHWSHMLAVRREARNLGIGKRLKFAQRKAAAAKGVDAVYWSFDPLVVRNAHFNLNQLGAAVTEYVPDMYGTTNSVLHRLGTDRFIARWDLSDDPEAVVRERENAAAGAGTMGWAVLGVPGESGALPVDADVVEVVVPGDIRAVEERCLDEALAWRSANRWAFAGLQEEGFEVVGFTPGSEYGRYVLKRVVR